MRRHAPQLAAAAMIAGVWLITGFGDTTQTGRNALAQRFRFQSAPLPVLTPSQRTIREVRPSLEPIAAWISSVGAAVALHDFDGDGLSNDVWYVDVRSDEVVVAPVPGSGNRFPPFNLLRARGCKERRATGRDNSA